MQTFLPYPDFARSAACLDRQRLGKQRLEAFQILQTNCRGPYIYMCPDCQVRVPLSTLKCKICGMPEKTLKQRKRPWYNHPATIMWRGHEQYLVDYIYFICKEWSSRGYKDQILEDVEDFAARYYSIIYTKFSLIPWLGRSEFHLTHQSNLIRKNPTHYRPIFGPEVPDNLPYIWPDPIKYYAHV